MQRSSVTRWEWEGHKNIKIQTNTQATKAIMMADNHIFLIILALLLVYMLWMDLALYFKVQSGYNEFLVVQNFNAMKSLNLNSTTRQLTTRKPIISSPIPYFDPFDPISVKLLMLDHLNHYLFYPLCWWLDTYFLHIADRLTFITADMISISHVFISAIGARY